MRFAACPRLIHHSPVENELRLIEQANAIVVVVIVFAMLEVQIVVAALVVAKCAPLTRTDLMTLVLTQLCKFAVLAVDLVIAQAERIAAKKTKTY